MRQALKAAPPLAQLAVVILLGIVTMIVLAGVYAGVLILLGYDASFMANLSAVVDPFGIEALSLKVLQVIQAIGLFIVPYVIYRWMLDLPGFRLGMRIDHWGFAVAFAIIMMVSLPLINFLAEWNAGLSLPDSLASAQEWIQEREDEVTALLEVFLVMENPWHLISNLVLIALIPAISEEVFFRGTVQPIFQRMFINHHIAIWVTAFLFSFFHMQFLGFFPRMLLGAVFGYAAYWSGSLMLPMIGHFVNNGLAVLITYFIGLESLSAETETIGANEGEWIFAITSAALLLGGMLFLRKNLPKEQT